MIKLEVSRDNMKVGKRKNKLKIIKIATPILMITCIVTFIICMIQTPKIELIDPELTIPVATSYEEPGYQAYANNQDISDRVKITGQVNTEKIGTYIINYEATYFLFHTKKIRIIEVIDEIPPIIELMGEKEVFVCPNNTYEELGYQAIDNYDKDLTSKVKIKEKKNELHYEVEDSSKNKTVVTRIIHYEDKESPKIELKGSSNITLYLGDKYKEPGYEVTDNCDKNLTSKVTVSGNVNSDKIGTYKITYQVTDSSNNQSTLTRTVVVTNIPQNENGIIYLTFDDGPSSTITGSILDILKQEGVSATFFVINHDDNLNNLIKREYEEGHTVALHSYSHNYANIYQSTSNYFEDLEKIKEKVRSITGETSNIIRFPGGSSNTISKRYNIGIMSELTKEVVNRGYHYFDWNISSGDAGEVHSSEEVYQNVITGLSRHKKNVVLMHDFEKNYYTLNALRDIIKYGKENGYTFAKITPNTSMVTHRVAN